MSRKSVRRKEVPDPTPMEIPARFKRPPSQYQQMAEILRSQTFLQHVASQGQETEEEANDFDVGDDFDPSSPWEESFYGQFDEDREVVRKGPPRKQAAPQEPFDEEHPKERAPEGRGDAKRRKKNSDRPPADDEE